MKRLKYFLLGLALVLFPLSPLYSESSYTITESQLQELKEILINYKTLETDYKKLQDNLTNLTETYTTTLTDLNQSLEILKKQNIKKNIIIGSVSFTIGVGVGALIVALIK